MKTQIIQLNHNDDCISVRDKIGWGQANRILLVLPATGHILYRKLDLVLVKRHVNLLGAQLAIVSRDSEVKFNARQIGIPVFSTLREARELHWRGGRQKIPVFGDDIKRPNLEEIQKTASHPYQDKQEHLITRIMCFCISVIALLLLVVFILPGANITVTPEKKVQSLVLSLTADPALESLNLSTGNLPAGYMEVIVEGSKVMDVTGKVIIPDRFAKAGLRFTNTTDDVIIIPDGTVVTTSGDQPIRFMITTNENTSIRPGKSVVLEAQAIKPGTSGNLPANVLTAIEGDLGLSVTVTNPNATKGGTNASIPSPSTQDLKVLREHLETQLERSALSALQSQLSIGDTLISPTLELVEVLSEDISPPVGEPGKQLNLTLRCKFTSLFVSKDELNQYTEFILNANTPSIYLPVQGTMIISRLSPPALGEDGKAHWSVQVERDLQTDLSHTPVIDRIKGLSIPIAMEFINRSLPLAEDAHIDMTPDWWPRLPFLSMRINLTQLEPE